MPRSFVPRNGRKTPAQRRALEALWPKFGLKSVDGMLTLENQSPPCYLEIGFGLGQSLLALAKRQPEDNFIGIEPHQPGIGSLLHGMVSHELSNIRVYAEDVIDVLQASIPDNFFAGVNIFFPDPWPKRRHHIRRLIQPAFIDLLLAKTQTAGTLHLATDWEDYAQQMMSVLSDNKQLENCVAPEQYAERSVRRPIITKFEQRALNAGRSIWELQFKKI